MKTNRDLYVFVLALCNEGRADAMPGLEQYLRSLWALAREWPGDDIPLEVLAGWLRDALLHPAPAFDDRWRALPQPREDAAVMPRDAWEHLLLFQIADLRRMAEAGMLADENRCFGLDSPSGARWYNFDPCSYLECGVCGAFGGDDEPGGEPNGVPLQRIT